MYTQKFTWSEGKKIWWHTQNHSKNTVTHKQRELFTIRTLLSPFQMNPVFFTQHWLLGGQKQSHLWGPLPNRPCFRWFSNHQCLWASGIMALFSKEPQRPWSIGMFGISTPHNQLSCYEYLWIQIQHMVIWGDRDRLWVNLNLLLLEGHNV